MQELTEARSCATRTEMVRPQDPFYAFLFPAVTLSPSLARILVPQWRGLVQSEDGLEHRLQSLPPNFVAEFRSHDSDGRSARERGDWESATLNFLHCKIQLDAEKDTVEQQTYAWLLAWADLQLAQLYQMRGSADMLEEALQIRREILDCITPLVTSHGKCVGVCETYCCTAQYEWGSVTNSEAKTDAILKFAELMNCDLCEAEGQLCHFLYLDHYQAGRFGVALQWIQEAHRLWKELCPDGSFYCSYCLQCEAMLFMKLEKFPEAVKALEDLPSAKDYVHQKHPQFALTLHDRLLECYTQMSRSAAVNGNAQLAKSYEELAELQHALKFSLNSDDNQESGDHHIPASHPIMMPTPFPIGSSLGLVQAKTSFELNLTKLPIPIDNLFRYHCKGAQAALELGDWEGAISEYQMGRQTLKISERIVEKEAHDWLLTWVDLPLANLYHFRAMKSEKAIEIWKEMLDCMSRQMPTDDFMYQGYAYCSFLAAVEFEWKFSNTSDGKYEIIRRYATLYHMGDERAERVLCFWLYFGHYHHGSLEVSLQWLREAKRLDKQHSPDRTCSSDEYFCCEYDYLRCEADLLMKLQRFEEAFPTIVNLLETRHVLQGSPCVGREARQWLTNCCLGASGGDEEEATDLQRALECSLRFDNQQHEEGLAEKLPSPTGCIMLVQIGDIAICGHTRQFIQSKAGLEEHLHQLPVPIHLAFRKHSNLGFLGQDHAGWEGAIFQFEWCRELLKFSRTAIEKESFDWLLVWADIPLVQLYEFRRMEFRKALDIWKEIFCLVPRDDNAIYMVIAINFHIYAGMYQCAVTDYPDFKDAVVRKFCKEGMLVESVDDRAGELLLLDFLQRQHFAAENLEVCLRFAQEARRLRFEHGKQDLDLDMEELNLKKHCHVIEEAVCFMNLGELEDAERVMDEYGDGISDGRETLEFLRKGCSQKRVSYKALLELQPSSTLRDLRVQSFAFEGNERYEEAVRCHEKCLEVLEKRRKDYRGWDIIIDKGLELGFYAHCRDEFHDYLRMGALHKEMYYRQSVLKYCTSMWSLSGAELKAPMQDAQFLRAVECFQECIELSNGGEVAQIEHHLVEIYALFDNVYYLYVMRLYNEIVLNEISSSLSPVIKFSNSDPSLQQTLTSLCSEIVAYLNLPNSLEKFARRVSVHHATMLYTREVHIESYIDQSLEKVKWSYIHLQEHYHRKASLLNILIKGNYEAGENLKGVQFCRWMAFLYAERERTRATLYQLRPNRFKQVASHELRRFENDDHLALEAVQRDCATLLKEGAVFVQFSRMIDREAYLIYVLDQDGNLSVTQTEWKGKSKRSLQARLKDLHLYLEGSRRCKRGYTEASMNEDLEFLHDLLIRPIADRLKNMNPDQKLILVPSELLAQVPFNALRNRDEPLGKRYLIERHTIALASSLRMQAKCSERLQELLKFPQVGRESIVALGDPAYGGKYPPLKGTGDEVRFIASLFPSDSVVTLLGKDANASNLLRWAEKPSRESFRQAIIHIGAHGVVDGTDHTKSVLRLARRASSSGDDSSISRGDFERLDDSAEEDEMDNSDIPSFVPISFQTPNLGPNCPGASIDAIAGGSRSGESLMQGNDLYDLKAGDIIGSETKWRAELVVLSACRTSQGKMTGEGVLSLARAFMIAGVPCVVASQWKVDDQSTIALMRDFYRGLQNGKDVASALRSAMVEMLKKKDWKVREWAPFAVWGVPTLCIPDHLRGTEELQRLPEANLKKESTSSL